MNDAAYKEKFKEVYFQASAMGEALENDEVKLASAFFSNTVHVINELVTAGRDVEDIKKDVATILALHSRKYSKFTAAAIQAVYTIGGIEPDQLGP